MSSHRTAHLKSLLGHGDIADDQPWHLVMDTPSEPLAYRLFCGADVSRDMLLTRDPTVATCAQCLASFNAGHAEATNQQHLAAQEAGSATLVDDTIKTPVRWQNPDRPGRDSPTWLVDADGKEILGYAGCGSHELDVYKAHAECIAEALNAHDTLITAITLALTGSMGNNPRAVLIAALAKVKK